MTRSRAKNASAPGSREISAGAPGISTSLTQSPRRGRRPLAGGADEATTPPAARVFGQPLTRREDDHHLRGRGRFTDDIRVGGLRPAFCMSPCLRSPHAHARIRSVSVDRAVKMPGVVTVVTGADLLDAVAPLPTNWVLPGMPVPVHRVLADEVVRFQGEGVAAVVAADAYTAADAADAIDVDYEPLPAVTDPWQAAQPNAPLVHPGLTDRTATSCSGFRCMRATTRRHRSVPTLSSGDGCGTRT